MIRGTIYGMYFILCLFFVSCKAKIPLKKLRKDNNCIYYKLGDKKKNPFSGVAYTTFENSIREDTNAISAVYSFVDGIPNGRFVEYANRHDIFEKGRFIPVLKISKLKSVFPSLRRINLLKIDNKYFDNEFEIFVISSQPSKDSIGFSVRKDLIVDFLVTNNYLNRNEILLIDTIGVWNGEF
jgi:hypothetical protein